MVSLWTTINLLYKSIIKKVLDLELCGHTYLTSLGFAICLLLLRDKDMLLAQVLKLFFFPCHPDREVHWECNAWPHQQLASFRFSGLLFHVVPMFRDFRTGRIYLLFDIRMPLLIFLNRKACDMIFYFKPQSDTLAGAVGSCIVQVTSEMRLLSP